jgi:hypothetical protein
MNKSEQALGRLGGKTWNAQLSMLMLHLTSLTGLRQRCRR